MQMQQRFWQKVDFNGPTAAHMDSSCWIWTAAKKGSIKGTKATRYGNFWMNGHLIYAHRVAYSIAYGAIPDDVKIDHACLNSLCCNPSHLRLVTSKQNSENRSGANRNSRSGIRGVYPTGNRWESVVWHRGKKIRVGTFDTVEAANCAVRAKRLELFTHNDVDRTL